MQIKMSDAPVTIIKGLIYGGITEYVAIVQYLCWLLNFIQ